MTGQAVRVNIYTADTAPLEDPALYAVAYAAVSPERRAKTDRVRFEKDKRLSLGAELLLMRACRDFGLTYAEHKVTEDVNGKPQFSSSPLRFNLSHSGERVMCVMSDRPVGCDVERIGQAEPEIAARFFHRDEYRALLGMKTDEERRILFYRFWTMKESFVKCTGLGLRLPLNGFCVSLSGSGTDIEQNVDDGKYIFLEDGPGDGYRYCCCVRFPDERYLFRGPERYRIEFDRAFTEALHE